MGKTGVLTLICLIACTTANGGASCPGTTGSGFEGKIVTASWVYPNYLDVLESHELLVVDDPTLPPADPSCTELNSSEILNDADLSIDIGANYLFFHTGGTKIWLPGIFNGWHFEDTNDMVPPIIDVWLEDLSPGIVGLWEDRIMFNEDVVWINLREIEVLLPDSYIHIGVLFDTTPIFLDGFESN